MKARSRPIKLHTAAAVKLLEQEINAAWADKDLEKCEKLLERVLKLIPRNTNAFLMLGRIHGVVYEYEEALDWFDRAVESAPKHERLTTLTRAGAMARDFFDSTIAQSLLEEAIALSNRPEAKLVLSEHLFRIRRIDMARMLVDEALETAPNLPDAIFLWCRLNEDQFNECEEKLRLLISAGPNEIKAKSGYQLAKMLDQAGDYDGAMEALSCAKKVLMPLREMIVRNRKNIRLRHQELTMEFSQAKKSEWQSLVSEIETLRKISLLGGHPRSGTTLLEQVLDSHPHIVSAEESQNFDIFAFSPLMRGNPPTAKVLDVMDSQSNDTLITARRNYFAAMDRCIGETVGNRMLVDKNPSLTPLAPAFCRIFPEIKCIAMIRDPRDVVLSCYMQSFVPVSGVNGTYLTLKDTAEEYHGVMSAWIKAASVLGNDKIEIRYEDMVEDLEGNARKVLDFLGVDWNESVMEYDRHAREKMVRSPTANAVTEKVHTRAKARWKNYQKHLEPIYETLKPCLKAFGYD